MEELKEIANTESFTDFTTYNQIYVDKTKEIYSLIKSRRIFLSRPRRFGKSTILDTIATLFEFGLDPYFKDTWIYDKWKDTTYPILRFSFIDYSFTNLELFKIEFCKTISDFAKEYDLVNFNENILTEPSLFLGELFRVLRLAKKNVVILIDEYDSQLTANINNPELYEQFKVLFREMYGVLKGKKQIRFLGITGVTRLKDVTIFSVGSDIRDFTYESKCASITGFTREEIAKYYIDYLNLGVCVSKNKNIDEVTNDDREELLDRIADQYNGYCFDSRNQVKVFSTWSVNCFFQSLYDYKELNFGDYWYSNGGIPSILANYLKTHTIDLEEYQQEEINVSYNRFVNPTSLLSMDQKVLMTQTGYLTLKSVLMETEPLLVGFPNKEVFRALVRLSFVEIFGFEILLSRKSRNNLENGSNEDIKNEFISIIQTTPYDHNPIANESVLRLLVYMFFVGARVNVRPEFQHLKGRSDLELEFENRRIVIEFKYADNENDAKEKLIQAQEQIKLRDYGNHAPSKECLVFALVYDGEKKEVKYFEKA